MEQSYSHVNMLVDAKGWYGIKIDGNESGVFPHERDAMVIVSRPDKIGRRSGVTAQKTSDGLVYTPTLFHALPRQRAKWAKGNEWDAASRLCELWCRDRQIPFHTDEYDAKRRREYYAIRSVSRATISKICRELYAATIPEPMLKLIRRYPINVRAQLFEWACGTGDNAWQLAETFPYLANYCTGFVEPDSELSVRVSGWETIQNLIVDGAKLRDIAGAAGFPMSLRRLPPALVISSSGLHGWLIKHAPLVAHHAPSTVPRMRAWLRAIDEATRSDDPDFAVWVAKHFDDLGYWRDVPSVTGDLRDWVDACAREQAQSKFPRSELETLLGFIRDKGEFGRTRGLPYELELWKDRIFAPTFAEKLFTPKMSPSTVLRHSDRWHELVANSQAAKYEFPSPWYSGGEANGHEIVPIENAGDLTRYGYELHNCAASYAKRIAEDDCYLYVVKLEEKAVAMLELARRRKKPAMVQLKGPCNAKASKTVEAAARKWLSERRKVEGDGREPIKAPPIFDPWEGDDGPWEEDDNDNELPF